MIGKIICWLFGHRRGKRVTGSTDENINAHRSGMVLFRCPRCGTPWTRKQAKTRVKATS